MHQWPHPPPPHHEHRCEAFGDVRCVRGVLGEDEGGGSSGHAWVRFSRAEDAAAALAAAAGGSAAADEDGSAAEADAPPRVVWAASEAVQAALSDRALAPPPLLRPPTAPLRPAALPASSALSREAMRARLPDSGAAADARADAPADARPTRRDERKARERAARRMERQARRKAVPDAPLAPDAPRRERERAGRERAAGAASAPQTRVLVAALPEGADELELRQLFRDCGDIREVQWPSRRQWQLGVRRCVLEFYDEAAAAKAVRNARHTNRRSLGGEPLEVSRVADGEGLR